MSTLNFGFEDLLRSSLVWEEEKSPGLWSSNGIRHPYSLITWNPKFEVTASKETFLVKFEEDETMSTLSSFRETWAFSSNASKIRSFIHDFTFGMWLHKTDSKLSTFFPLINSKYSELTPDYIGKVSDRYVVVEFTTRSTGDYFVLRKVFNEKKAKYEEALRDASLAHNEPIYFFVVVVGDNEVFSDLSLTQEDSTELGYRYKVAKSIKASIQNDFGILDVIEDEMTDAEWQILSWMKTLTLEGMDDSMEFSPDSLLNLARESTPEESANFKRDCNILLMTSIAKARNDRLHFEEGSAESLEKEEVAWKNYVTEFYSRYSSSENESPTTSKNQKTVANVPLISLMKPLKRDYSSDLPPLEVSCGMSSFWSQCLDNWKAQLQEEPSSDGHNDNGGLREEALSVIKKIRTRTADHYLKKEHMKQMRTRNRVVVSVDYDTQIDFAKVGVKAKSLAWLPQVKEYRKNAKLSLDLDVDVSDIEAFLTHENLIDLAKSTHQTVREAHSRIQRYNLIRKSDEIISPECSTRYKYHEELKAILDSHLFNWGELVSDIANELAISFKHHCGPEEYVVKKLKEFDLWIAISPTRSGSHIFFSLLWQAQDSFDLGIPQGKVFRQWHTDGSWCWTEWVSLDSDKLTNWALLESRIISLTEYWMEFHGLEPLSFSRITKESTDVIPSQDLLRFEESIRMTLVSILISLADKAEVEETISCSRFIIMEGFTSYPCWPRPYKMYEKFPLHIKSRLTIWALHKLKTLSRTICTRPYKLKNISDLTPEDIATENPNPCYLTGFKNPFTGFDLRDAGQLINLMYLGYIKNKNETGQANTAGKLVEKIVTLERKFTKAVQERIGRVDRPLMTDSYHEWNMNFLRQSCELAIKDLNLSNSGIAIQKSLGAEWIRRLSLVSIEDTFCTLKATSNFDKEWFNYKEALENWKKKRSDQRKKKAEKLRASQEPGYMTDNSTQIPEIPEPSSADWANQKHCYSRSKLIERCVITIPEGEISMGALLKDSYEKITKQQFLRVCIFKKQQHGGLREIFVLGFEERVVQFAIELAGRIICEKFMGETMTHPQSKKLLIIEHHRKVKAKFKKGTTVTTYTSADSSKWSQNQYCAKLLQVFLKFYPKEMHNFFIRSLELWRKKKIKISDDLLFLLEHNPDVQFWDPITQELSDAYHGKKQSDWMGKGNSYLNVKTGMMQGILHYSSSAFHSITNKAIEITLKNMTKQARLPQLRPVRLEVTTLQSSDDSGMIVTVNHRTTSSSDELLKIQKTLKVLAAAFHFYKSLFSEEVAIKDSIKTTFNSLTVFEFNSKFHVLNQLYEPEIKLAYASNLISHSDSMISKQEEAYTLISSYISTGGSCYIAKWLQYSQAFFHYRTLGSNVSPYWFQLYRILSTTNDPCLGFFMNDHLACAGIPGFNFNYWAHVTKTDLSKTARHHLEKLSQVKEEELKKREKETIDDLLGYVVVGGVTRNNFMSFGEMAKVQRMKRMMELPSDWMDYIDNNPIILFRNSQTKEELKIKASIKLSQSGVAASLSGSPPVSTNLASSIYIIQEHIMNLVCSSLIDLKDLTPLPGDSSEKDSQPRERYLKYSLLELYVATYCHECVLDLDPKQEAILFPLADEYTRLWAYLSTNREFHFSNKSWNKKRVVTDVQVYQGDSSFMVNPYSILADIWFPNEKTRLESRYGTNQTRLLFESMKESFPWLDESPEVTLLHSPFHNFLSLFNWFKTLSSKTRKISIVGAPISSNRGQTSVMTYIRTNAGRYHNMLTSEVTPPVAREHMGNKQHILNLLLNTLSYPKRSAKMRFLRTILSQYESFHQYEMSRTHSRYNSLNIVSSMIKNSPNLSVHEASSCFGRLKLQANTIEQIMCNKEGSVGYWEIRQNSWNAERSTYEGPGSWTGVINGYRTHIKVNSYPNSQSFNHVDSIETVDINSPREVQSWIKGVITWAKDAGCSLTYLGPVRGSIKRLKNKSIRVSDTGVPVHFLNPSKFSKIDWSTGTNFSLSFPDHTVGRTKINIRLMYESPHDKRSYTMLSIPLNLRDWTAEKVPSSLIDNPEFRQDPYFESWVLNMPLSIPHCTIAINQALQLKQGISKDMIANCLRSQLINKGINIEKIAPSMSIISGRIALQDSPPRKRLLTESSTTSDDERAASPQEDDFFGDIDLDSDVWGQALVLDERAGSPDEEDVELDIFEDDFDLDNLEGLAMTMAQEEEEYGQCTSSIWETITGSHPYMRLPIESLTSRYRSNHLISILSTRKYPAEFGVNIEILKLAFPGDYTRQAPLDGPKVCYQIWDD